MPIKRYLSNHQVSKVKVLKKRKIRPLTKAGYGLGSIVIATQDNAFNFFLLFYYVQVLGLSGTLAGMAMLIGLCVDAVTDPVMGSISDNFQSKYGRRHPFLLIAALPLALSMVALFSPAEGLAQIGLFVWMTLSVVAVRIFLTIYNVPYLALGAEITEDYVERTTMATYRTTFAWFGGVAIAIIAFTVFFPQTEAFEMGQMNLAGYPPFGLFCGAIIIVTALICVFSTHKEIPHLPPAPKKPEPLRMTRLFHELVMALKNPSFRILFLSLLVTGALTGVLVNIGLVVNTYFWELTSEEIALITTSMLLASIIAFALMSWLERYEKKKVFIVLCFFTILSNCLVILRLLDLLPPNGSPTLIKLIYLQTLYTVTIIIIQSILISSIIADAVDEGELITHVRQEGMYFAFLSFGGKTITGFGSLLAGLIIDFIGLPPKAVPGTVEPSVIWNLGFIVGPILGLCWFIPLFILLKLQLTRKRSEEIRKELDARKKAQPDMI
jgi:GPH family glycoside/pentoside/hexuronide:cation symporter